jgi:glycerol-3-phosphate acyltransferase PlsY
VIEYLVLVPVGYVLGSVPFGLVAGRAFKRIDVRDFGSGKTGASNVLRSVGVPAAILVMMVDMGKAILAVVLVRVFSDSHGVEAAAALATLFGHNWPVFVGFRGGRGTASGWGGLLILEPWSGLAALIAVVPVIAITRYMSLGSIVAAIAGATTLIVLAATGHAPLEYIWFGIIGGTLIVGRHHDNIHRLLRGQERKLGQAAEAIQRESKAEKGRGMQWPRSV